MDAPTTSPRCRRAHEWISLRADGELSQFEEALLDAHLMDCEACRAFSAGVMTTTREIRLAPLARPDRPIALPPRRRPVLRPLSAGAAAVAAVAAAYVAFFVVPQQADVSRAGRGLSDLALVQDEQQMRDVQRANGTAAASPRPARRTVIGHVL
jgi:predicted anti-sigma-YlaC factor YlaD